VGGIIVKQKIPFLRNFNWRILLLRLLINALALLITALLVPSIYFVDRSFASLLVLALGLGILNALVKPVIQVLTLRLLFASYGLIVILINSLMLFLLSYFMTQRFAVDSVFWAIVGGALIGLLGSLLESLLGVTPPIVAERYPDLRARIKEGQVVAFQTLLEQPLPALEEEIQEVAAEAGVAGTAKTVSEPEAVITDVQAPAGGAA
jgi:putative membrane protein